MPLRTGGIEVAGSDRCIALPPYLENYHAAFQRDVRLSFESYRDCFAAAFYLPLANAASVKTAPVNGMHARFEQPQPSSSMSTARVSHIAYSENAAVFRWCYLRSTRKQTDQIERRHEDTVSPRLCIDQSSRQRLLDHATALRVAP
jgi:hypothetical protein